MSTYVKLRSAKTFSGVATNLPKQRPGIIKLKSLKNLQQLSLGPVFPNMVFLVQNRKNEYQHRIHYIRICIYTKFSLKRRSWFYGPKLSKWDVSSQKQQQWTLLLDSIHSNYCNEQISTSTDNIYSFQSKKKKKGYLNITIKFNKIALAYSHSQNIWD